MTITAENLVNREVHYCVSNLVYTLASGCGGGGIVKSAGNDLAELVDQALELAASVDDWESAAREAGWECADTGIFHDHRDGNATGDDCEYADDWQEACDITGLDPYQSEVFEHWIVSDWLADKLLAHGEKVDKDFAGLTVWARTTTGQGIAMDAVIQKIAAELIKGDV